MRRHWFGWSLMLLFGTGLIVAVVVVVVADETTDPAAALVERGRYLTTIGGCNDCHTPKRFTDQGMLLDSARLFSGHPADESLPAVPKEALAPGQWSWVGNDGLTAFGGPWGVSYAANLTGDEQTGLGNWTDDQFIKAMRTGKHRGFGRPLLPPMPWQNLAEATDDDLKAVLAFFKSTHPVSNKVPVPVAPAED